MVDFNDESLCKQCGMCCHTTIKGYVTSCKYLIDLGDGKTKCEKWRDANRLGTIIARKGRYVARCRERKDSQHDYPGCPYNTDKPCFVKFIKRLNNV